MSKKEKQNDGVYLLISDRLVIQALLPLQEGTFNDHLFAETILEQTKIKKEDVDKYNIETVKDEDGNETGNLMWDIQKDIENPILVNLSDGEVNLLCKVLEGISEGNKMTTFTFNLAKKVFPLKK